MLAVGCAVSQSDASSEFFVNKMDFCMVLFFNNGGLWLRTWLEYMGLPQEERHCNIDIWFIDPGKFSCDFKIFRTHIKDMYLEHFLWITVERLVKFGQLAAWWRQVTSHYLSHCWLRCMLPYGVTTPQWVLVPRSSKASHHPFKKSIWFQPFLLHSI